jgi:hypothetical protein
MHQRDQTGLPVLSTLLQSWSSECKRRQVLTKNDCLVVSVFAPLKPWYLFFRASSVRKKIDLRNVKWNLNPIWIVSDTVSRAAEDCRTALAQRPRTNCHHTQFQFKILFKFCSFFYPLFSFSFVKLILWEPDRDGQILTCRLDLAKVL